MNNECLHSAFCNIFLHENRSLKTKAKILLNVKNMKWWKHKRPKNKKFSFISLLIPYDKIHFVQKHNWGTAFRRNSADYVHMKATSFVKMYWHQWGTNSVEQMSYLLVGSIKILRVEKCLTELFSSFFSPEKGQTFVGIPEKAAFRKISWTFPVRG